MDVSSDSIVIQREDVRPHSRGAMRPSFVSIAALDKNKRAQGKPGARCTRGLACNSAQKNAHEHTGSAEAIRPSLRSGLPAYSELSPVTGLSCHRRPREVLLPANLTPASGCQDHTASPSARVTLVSRNFRVHRIPPHVRDDREPPLSSGETGEVKSVICPTAKAKYFRAEVWTGFSDLPVGLFCRGAGRKISLARETKQDRRAR
jgi:hypothetical protein